MRVRRFQPEKDYPIIKSWWERRGATAPHPVLLPVTGVMVEDGWGPLACAFLYEDKSGKVAMVEWECTNPAVESALRTLRALNQLFDFFEIYCRDKAIAFLLSWTEEGRGDGRLLRGRKWTTCPGPRHELMCFETQKGGV